MAVPKKKKSKMKRRIRRAVNLRMPRFNLSRCTHCNAAIQPHRVCHNCGHYAGKPVIELEEF